MYPGTKFNWYDQSDFAQETTPEVISNVPLFMVVSSFDKGPEDLMEVKGTDFSTLFGKMSFEKHGQNAIQAQNIINAGGALLVKRVVASDSTLANIVLVAEVVGDKGSLQIKWSAESIESVSSYDKLLEEAKKLTNAESGKFALFIIGDNGRGASNKSVRIIPDYTTSKNIGKMFYTLAVFEGTQQIESQTISFDPEVIYLSQAYGYDKDTTVQVIGEVDKDAYDDFVQYIYDKLEDTETYPTIDSLKNNDLVFGYTVKGDPLKGFSTEPAEESLDLNVEFGNQLKNGSNGAFGDKPAVNSEENSTAYAAWSKAIADVYLGNATDEVWDVDQHKIFAICDANLPQTVKDAIVDFVAFREDCMFFRDYGTGLTTFEAISTAYQKNSKNNRFVADYITSYNIKDPLTKKVIEVTMMYDFAACLVASFNSGAFLPLAGTLNGFILPNAIKGSVNYVPMITPKVNRKQAIDDLRLNYAIFEGDNCVVQSLYTSQDKYTQLSYANNVLAIQEVMRAVRTQCPRNRYAFNNTIDMTEYARDVQNILSYFKSNFETLEFEYTQDNLRASQKIFYASIRFRFGSWVQSEIFDLFALQNE